MKDNFSNCNSIICDCHVFSRSLASPVYISSGSLAKSVYILSSMAVVYVVSGLVSAWCLISAWRFDIDIGIFFRSFRDKKTRQKTPHILWLTRVCIKLGFYGGFYPVLCATVVNTTQLCIKVKYKENRSSDDIRICSLTLRPHNKIFCIWIHSRCR